MQEKDDQLESAQELIKELRQQLEGTRQEVSKLTETMDLRNTKIQHLELDVNTLKDQLQNAITAKCNAIAKYDEIQHKESSIDSREKLLENENSLLQKQIVSITEELKIANSNSSDLVKLNSELTAKFEELNNDFSKMKRITKDFAENFTKIMSQ
jgi:nucleoprotein TPR